MTPTPEHHRPAERPDAAEPDDLVEFVAAESARAPVDDGVPGAGWRGRVRGLFAQLVKFGLVGGLGVVVDLGAYNLIMLTVLSGEHPDSAALAAKALTTLLAICTNWIGNRLWAFRDHRRADRGREALEFFGVSLAGLVIGMIPLWIFRSAGLSSLGTDNIANVIGLFAGALFRFALYRFWVFAPRRRGAKRGRGDSPAAAPSTDVEGAEPRSVATSRATSTER